MNMDLTNMETVFKLTEVTPNLVNLISFILFALFRLSTCQFINARTQTTLTSD